MKRVLDTVARWVQSVEESFATDAVLLDVERSIQIDGYSCGAQSAYMVLRHFGKARSIAAVTHALGTDQNGTGTKALLTLFRRRGLKPIINARARIGDLRRAIIEDAAPCLVSLDAGGHFGIVFGVGPGKVYLADPSIRQMIRVGLSAEKFDRRWDHWLMAVRARRA